MVAQRLLIAAYLVGGLLALYFFASPWVWQAAVTLVLCFAAWEWVRLVKLPHAMCWAYVVACALIALVYPMENISWVLWAAFLFWLLVVPMLLWRQFHLLRPVISALLGMLLLVPAAISMVWLKNNHPDLLLVVIATVGGADGGAFFAGRALGRHKLAPRISPGKSWEGVAGGVFGGYLLGLMFWRFFHPTWPLWLFPVLLVLIALSVMGDLLESLVKRQAQVKDSGHLLSQHGGVLDRIDGLLAALPLTGLAALHFSVRT